MSSRYILMKLINLLVGLLLVATALGATVHSTDFLWPRPVNVSMELPGANLTVSPCNIKYVINAADKIYIH